MFLSFLVLQKLADGPKLGGASRLKNDSAADSSGQAPCRDADGSTQIAIKPANIGMHHMPKLESPSWTKLLKKSHSASYVPMAGSPFMIMAG